MDQNNYNKLVLGLCVLIVVLFKLSTTLFESKPMTLGYRGSDLKRNRNHFETDFKQKSKVFKQKWNIPQMKLRKNIIEEAQRKNRMISLEENENLNKKALLKKDSKKKESNKKKKVAKKNKKGKVKNKKSDFVVKTPDSKESAFANEEKDLFDNLKSEREDVPIAGLVPDLKKSEDKFNNFDYWKTKLLDFPNKSALRELIEVYSVNLVSESLFYDLISALLEDPRDEMKSIGLLGLSATQSLKSFLILADFSSSEKQSKKSLNQAKKYLESYTTKTHLSILNSVIISSQNDFTISFTAYLLEKLIKSSLGNFLEEGFELEGENEVFLEKDIKKFKNLLVDLKLVAETYVNSQVKNQLERTIDLIEGALDKTKLALGDSSDTEDPLVSIQ